MRKELEDFLGKINERKSGRPVHYWAQEVMRDLFQSKTGNRVSSLDQIAMAKLNLFNAIDIIETAGKHSIISFTEGDEQRMMLMGLRRYLKYTNMPNIIELRNIIADKITEENKYCF